MFIKALTVSALVLAVGSAHAADVGVSVQISQPGVYGRIDLGRFPQPAVVVAQPVWVAPPVVVAGPRPEPVYMWVPPGHRKNWRQHCRRYQACGTPVYFVQDRWYRSHVAPPPQYHDRRDDDRGRHGRGHGHGRGGRHD